MKRKFCFLVVVGFLMLYPFRLVFAQEEAVEAVEVTEAALRNWREKIKEKIELRKEKLQEKKTAIKTRLTERARTRIDKIYQRIRNRLQNRIERLEKITLRIKNRFLFFAEKGRNITEASAKVAEAEEAIAAAKNNLGIVDEKLKELLSSNEPRTALKELKTTVHAVRKDLSTARQALAETVNLLARNNQGGKDVEN